MEIAPTLPLPTLSEMPLYVDHVVKVDGIEWSVSLLADCTLVVDEVSTSDVRRGASLEPAFYKCRAHTVGDAIRLAIDHSTPTSVVVQEVVVCIMRNMVLMVDKDDALPISISVGAYSTATDGFKGFACIQDPHGNLIVGEEEFDVMNTRMHYAVSVPITYRQKDWSAFGAARKFVEFVGTIRAREAIRKAAAECFAG